MLLLKSDHIIIADNGIPKQFVTQIVINPTKLLSQSVHTLIKCYRAG